MVYRVCESIVVIREHLGVHVSGEKGRILAFQYDFKMPVVFS